MNKRFTLLLTMAAMALLSQQEGEKYFSSGKFGIPLTYSYL